VATCLVLAFVAYRGGNCNNDADVGAFYSNLNNSAGNTNWNIGASVTYLEFLNATYFPCLLAKMNL
jgi:hypothetical protein